MSGLPEDAATPYTVRARRRAGVAGAGQPVPAQHRCARTGATAPRASCSARAAPPIRTSRRSRSRPTSTTAGARSTRCGRSRCGWRSPIRTSGRTSCCCSATRCTPTRSRPTRSSSSVAARHEQAARRDDRRLRGVHPALPRGLDRPADPVAALDRAVGDDLRRPRRDRRLEHVGRVGGGDARHRLVGPARRRRLHGVHRLPALGQPAARPRSRRRTSTSSVHARPATAAISCARTRTSATARSRARAGATAATSARRGS